MKRSARNSGAALGPWLLLAALGGTAQAQGPAVTPAPQEATRPESGQQRLLIRFKDSTGVASAGYHPRTALLDISDLDNRVQPRLPQRGPVRLSLLKSITPQLHVASTDQRLSRTEMQQLIEQLRQDPKVEYAEIDERIQPQLLPADPYYQNGNQWNLQPPVPGVEGGANLPGAWDQADGQGTVVALLDTGIRPHPDIAASRVLPGYDFVSDIRAANDGDGRDADPSDPGDWVGAADTDLGCATSDSSWHGTKMAGLIAATASNAIGISGTAPRTRILPVRVFGKCGGYVSDVVDGVYWAIGLSVSGVPLNPNPARVLNLSMAAPGECSNSFQNAITAARSRGALVIAAAGNNDIQGLGQPANCSGVVAVTAHTRRGDLAHYANTSASVTLSAPGGGDGIEHLDGDGDALISTSNQGTTLPTTPDYEPVAGTSAATAQVSGVAALLLGLDPALAPDQTRWLLTSTARAFPNASYCHGRTDCGAGLLDASAAVQRLQDGPLPTISEPPVTTSGSGGGGGAPGWLDLLGLSSLALLRRRWRRLITRQPRSQDRQQATGEPGHMGRPIDRK